ncbi:DUF6268 family outer membrane beta-barrel protein [Bacterioplanoides pacificum]|uniref:DUF6268 family outer membrane beta-barrel protein n=1 Tax=Bacterioplanoides pacificum TaxID=1171596 RepID=A0ABV7VTE8_9GAMM
MTKYARRLFLILMLLPLSPAWSAAVLLSSEGPGSPDDGAGSEFASRQISLTLPLAQQKQGSEQLHSYLHLDQTRFELTGTSAAQSDYFWLSLPLRYQQQRSHNTAFLVNAEAGLMTDLNSLNSESVGLNLELLARRYVALGRRSDKQAYWQFGVVLDRAFGDYSPRPALMYSWQLSPATRVSLGFPRTQVRSRWGRDFTAYLHIRPAGGVWREEIKGQDAVSSVSYRNWRAGVGGEFHWRSRLWLVAELGQTRLRTLTADDASGTRVVSRPGDDVYTQFGLRLRF